MTIASALSLALLAITVLVTFLAAAIVTGRWWRGQRVVRRLRTVAQVRPVLLALLAEDDLDERRRLLDQVLRTDPRTWAALEPTIAELLTKLRGDAHAVLRTLVERRGTVARARRRVHRMGAVGRARAAELLGGLEDPIVTGDLVRRLYDRDGEVRQVAARALGRSGDPAAATPLLRCLARSSVPPRVVSQALLRLGSGAHGALVSALEEPDELVRAVAVEILGLSSAVTAARAVEGALRNDESLEVRIRAARALGRVGLPSAVPALVDATAHDRPAPLRIVAARALGDLGHPDAVRCLRGLLGDPLHRLASNAAQSLTLLGPAGTAALEAAATGPAEDLCAQRANEALARLRLLAAHSGMVRAELGA